MRLLVILIALAIAQRCAAQDIGKITIRNGSSAYKCSAINANSAHLLVGQSGSSECNMSIQPSALTGSCIGDVPGDFCGDGTGPTWLAGPMPNKVGGLGQDGGDFTYDGAVASCNTLDATGVRSRCRWGTCTGSEGSGVCTITYNSDVMKIAAAAKQYAVLNVTAVTISAGTVKGGAPPASTQGSGLIFRVQGNVSITGAATILDVRALGGAGGASGGTCSTQTGAAGGGNLYYPGGTAGTATTTTAGAGTAITSTLDATLLPFVPSLFIVGAGGGSRSAGGTTINGLLQTLIGGTGGGGGGCAASCSGTSGAGGAGGGFVGFDVGGTYTCTASTAGGVFRADGAAGGNGGAGGGGGGGGGVIVRARIIGTDTCGYTVTGGTGGTAGANCAAGGAGGNGIAIRQTLGR